MAAPPPDHDPGPATAPTPTATAGPTVGGPAPVAPAGPGPDLDLRAMARAVLVAPFTARTWRETIHAGLALPFGLLWFVSLITLLSVGVGLIPVALIGLVVLYVTMYVVQLGALVERSAAQVLLDVDVDPPVRRRPSRPGPIADFRARALDPVTWKELIYLGLCFPLGTASFVAATAVWGTALLGVLFPLWGSALTRGNSEDSATLWAHGPDLSFGEYAANFATGLVALFLAPWVMRAFALLREAMVKVLLGRSREQELESEVGRLVDSRAATVDRGTSDRARIERDLHDGAQARLVALAMDLGRARDRLERQGGNDDATTLVADAHEKAKAALAELRDLARGILPTVLTDRGLDAALSALAAASPVVVDLRSDLPVRPSPRIEAVAYFVLSELLANVARHSGATRVVVAVARHGDRLVLDVEDDGIGGADPSRGTGLTGLAGRVEAVDGTLTLDSPAGGPTKLRVDLPFV